MEHYMGKLQKTSPKAIKANEMSVKAVELRKAGATYEMIAQQLGYSSKSTAFNAVNRVMQSTKREAGKEAFEIELRRLDDLFMSLWPSARSGELGAVDRCLRIMESRRKMLGLDAPEKSQQQIMQVIRVSYEDVQFVPQEFEEDVETPQLMDYQDSEVTIEDDAEEYEEEVLDDDDTMEQDNEE